MAGSNPGADFGVTTAAAAGPESDFGVPAKASAPPAVKSSSTGHSFLHNLGHDAEAAINGTLPALAVAGKAAGSDLAGTLTFGKVGTPFGKSELVQKVVKPEVKAETAQYAPLAHGNISQFYKNFHAHPLGPILDVATLLTGGAARLAALKTLPEDAKLADAAKALKTGKYQGPLRTIKVQGSGLAEPVTVRTLPRNAARAARMVATDKALKKITKPETAVVGEFARAARALKSETLPIELAHRASDTFTNYLKTFSKLSAHQRVALNALIRLPLPKDLEAWKHILSHESDPAARKLLTQLNHPKVMAEYFSPSDKLMAAHTAANQLSDLRGEIMQRTGALDPLTAETSPLRHMFLARGAKYIEPTAKRIAAGKPTGLVGRSNAADLLKEVADAGRPLPFYVPDKMAERGIGFGRKSSGLSEAASDIHASEGHLFKAGLLALHPDVLGPSFIRAAVRDRQVELHDRILDVAIPAPNGKLQHGYRWVRAIRNQKIPHTATNYGDHLHDLDEAFPDDTEHGLTIQGDPRDLNDEAFAKDAKGQRLMVPERFAKTLEADLEKGHTAAGLFAHRIMSVWRALILNLRVPWLENNVIGNALMASVRFAGPHGLAAVLGMIETTKGAEAARRALGMAEQSGHLTSEDMAVLLPELSKSGTFIGSQLPSGVLAKAPVAVQKVLKAPGAIVGALPKLDRATEGALRRASAETVLRGSEEVKALYKAMPKQTRSWRAAMQTGLKDPDLRRLVVREVNDALGNFLSLSPTEANAIRSLIPFYAWFREITRITLKLPLDAPGRTDLIARLGQVGNQNTLQNVPSYLAGAIPYGGAKNGLQNIVGTLSPNPYSTVTDVVRSVGSIGNTTPANSNSLLGDLNPFAAALAQYLAQTSEAQFGGTPPPKYGIADALYQNIGLNLPQVRVATNPPSKLYPTRTREDLLKQLLGDPRRTIDPAVAAADKAAGQ